MQGCGAFDRWTAPGDIAMTKSFLKLSVTVAAMTFLPVAANASYFLFDGDAKRAVEIDGGRVVNAFDIQGLGYPVSITDTIWLGDRDNMGSVEYKLDGTPTGNTGVGVTPITQLLDGTTNGRVNYGVTCCDGQNYVTVANLDWSEQSRLFSVDFEGAGIAYSSRSNSLFVSNFGTEIVQFSLEGQVLGSFDLGKSLYGLAYQASSDTLWGWDAASQSLEQYTMDGKFVQGQRVDVVTFGITNPYGGEFAFAAAAVPEPAAWAMFILGFGLVGGSMRRRQATTVLA